MVLNPEPNLRLSWFIHKFVYMYNMALNKKPSGKILRFLLIIAGMISSALGFIGVFMPLLPTTPFLLLAAACFFKGSDRFYNWLLNNRWVGTYIRNYREKKGIPLRIKIKTIVLLWITIAISAIFFVTNIFVRILLLLIAIGVTIHLVLIKTYKNNS